MKLPRLYYGWWIVAANSAIIFVGGLHFHGTSVYFLPMSKSLGLSRAQLSFVFATTRLEGGAQGPIIGWLIDRLGARLLILVGAILFGVGYILMATVVHNFWALFVVYATLIGTGFAAGYWPPVIASANKWFIRRRTVALSIFSTTSRIGALLLTPLISLIVLNLGWRTAALIAGVTMMSIIAALSWVNRPSPEAMGLLPDGDRPGLEVTNPGSVTVPSAHAHRINRHEFTVKEALKTSTFWLLTLAQVLYFISQGAILLHFIPMLVWREADPQTAANLYGLMGAIGIPAALLCGWAGDRFNLRRLLAGIAGLAAVGLALVTFGTQTWHLYLFALLYGIVEGGFYPVVFSMTGDYFGRKSFATLRGLTQLFTAISGFAAAFLTGWAYDKTESYTLALVVLTLTCAASIPLYLAARPPRPPHYAASAGGNTGALSL